MKAIAVYPGKPNSMHLEEIPMPRVTDIPGGCGVLVKVWQPRRAAVVGAGTIGLLATLGMRLRGVEVTCYSRRLPPYFNSDLMTELGAHYVSSQQATLTEASEMHGPFDIIFEASGFSPLAFQAAEALGKNGVLVLSSVTGGEKKVEVNADKINQGFVLGNKVMVGTVNA